MGGHRPSDWHVLDLEKDPTPGDPHRVRSLAKNLHDFSDDVGRVLRDIKGMAGDEAILKWVGKTADAFTEKFEDAPSKLKKLQKSYSMAGDALAAYWPELERAQSLADKALAKGREAQADLTSAKSRLSSADSWVEKAGKEADKYKDEGGPKGKDVPKPDEEKVRAATRNATSAEKAQKSAKSDVSAAQSALDAAKKMAEDARKMRAEAAGTAKKKIDEASDAGIRNRHWWEEIGDWVSDNWDTIVAVCKVVVAVVGVIAMIIGGPILAAIVIVAGAIVLADTLSKYAKGQAGLMDVAFAALDCVPGMKGLTTAAKLGKGLKGLKGGLKGFKSARTALKDGAKGAYNRVKSVVRSKGSDPVDMATGEMFLPQTDITLPGDLPLHFTRRLASQYRSGWWFGPTWASTIDQRLEIDEQGILFVTEDGLLLPYPFPEAPSEPVLPDSGPRWPLTCLVDGGYEIGDPATGHIRHFGAPVGGLALLQRIADRNGNTIEVEYAPDGAPHAIRHSGGYRLVLTVNEERVTALSLAGGAEDGSDVPIKSFRYTDGNLTEVINSSGQPLRFTYDEHLRVTSWTDTNARRYDYTYDRHHRCVAEGGEAGHITIALEYDGTDPAWPDCRVTTLTTAEGAVSRFVINDRSQVVAEIDALGGITRTAYDAHHHIVAITDQAGHTTHFAHDGNGHPTEIRRPDGAVLRFVYNAEGAPVILSGPDGGSWHREYDNRGNCISMTNPAGATTRFTYDAAGHVTRVTDALGNARSVRCNAAGLPVSMTDPLGAVTSWERDTFGRIVAYTDPLGNTTRLAWTVEGRLLSRITPDGATERWTYDGEGNCTSHTTPTGAVTRFEYTHFDLQSARIGPDGVRYEFSHDPGLRLVQVTNPQGLAWTYRHDAAGRLVSETDFDGRNVTYAHDAVGRLASRTDALGHTTRYEHDAVGNLTRKTTGSGVTHFTYDLNQRLTGATGPDATLSLHRDSTGSLTRETVNGRHMLYQHDVLGRLVRRTTPSGAVTRWTYDAAGNRTELNASGRTLRFEHDWSGREAVRRFGDDVTLTHVFDEVGRLSAQSLEAAGRRVQHRAFSYGEAGNLLGVDDQLRGSRRFDLDTAGRVTAVCADNWNEQYAYDEVGNQTLASWPDGHPGDDADGTRVYSGTHIVRAGRTRYEHDALGRTVLRQKARMSRKPDTWRYIWDPEDRLSSVTTPDGTVWRYRYDPLGRRIAKERLAADGQTVDEEVLFTWDGVTLCEQTTRARSLSHDVTLTWDHDGFHPITQTERITATKQPQDEIDSRFFCIVTDLVGTPTELVDEHGDMAWRTRATLWGSTAWNSDATAYTPIRFPGQYFDPETGLHYNYFRHYDPETGRYLTQDPLGLAPAPNPATYVHNPHTGIDPLGLSPYYSEIAANGQRGPAYAEVTPQTLDDAANNLIGSEPGRGRRYAPPGFVANSNHSRGHLIGKQFGGDGRDMRNIVTQDKVQNNDVISKAEGQIADHVRASGNKVIMSVTPEYANGGDIPSHVLIEAVDDFGWSFRDRIPNM
ncbi:RHS repeat-associated core domain-containing protein [Streptomyces sp. NPDC058284]|uniref:RHS repeat-associated core domain-containing protein n=1 Tax=unclassified Streptomyces TaxID=2593676 RepID=UPI003658E43B